MATVPYSYLTLLGSLFDVLDHALEVNLQCNILAEPAAGFIAAMPVWKLETFGKMDSRLPLEGKPNLVIE